MPLEWLFGRKKTPEEMLRQNQRALNKAMRDLDRERSKMEQQEKKVIADIKNMAKKGQMVSVVGKNMSSPRKSINSVFMCMHVLISLFLIFFILFIMFFNFYTHFLSNLSYALFHNTLNDWFLPVKLG
jgi:Fe2+ transport system protein B